MNDLQIRQLQISAAKDEIRCCNELNQLNGLTLTEADITELVELRGQALRSTGRVEFGGGILPKLIRAFCKSPYVDPYNYAATLGDLQDAFLRHNGDGAVFFSGQNQGEVSEDRLDLLRQGGGTKIIILGCQP